MYAKISSKNHSDTIEILQFQTDLPEEANSILHKWILVDILISNIGVSFCIYQYSYTFPVT